MRSNKQLLFLVSGTLLGGLLWLTGRLLVTAIYNGDAGGYLNQLITGQTSHPLAEYLAAYNRIILSP